MYYPIDGTESIKYDPFELELDPNPITHVRHKDKPISEKYVKHRVEKNPSILCKHMPGSGLYEDFNHKRRLVPSKLLKHTSESVLEKHIEHSLK